jgi:hypothetical protein
VVLSFAKIRASVVLPHCLGPRRAVIGERLTARDSWVRYTGRSIMDYIYH